MKHFYSHKTAAAALSLLLLAVPFSSFAQTPTKTDTKFCTNLGTVHTAVNSKLSERLTTAEQKNKDHADQFVQKKDAAVANLQAKRADVQTKWQAHVADLQSKAKTDAQKAAVATFVTTVQNLTTTRHTAVDTAVATFTDGLKNLEDTRTGDFSAMVSKYQSDIEAAFTKAQTSCTNGTDPSTVRTQLKSDLSAVRDAFRSDREAHATTYKASFQTLRTARINAVTSAGDTFRTGFAQAKNTLRDAFAASRTTASSTGN